MCLFHPIISCLNIFTIYCDEINVNLQPNPTKFPLSMHASWSFISGGAFVTKICSGAGVGGGGSALCSIIAQLSDADQFTANMLREARLSVF